MPQHISGGPIKTTRSNRQPGQVPAAGPSAARGQPPVGWVQIQAEAAPDLAVMCELGSRKPWATAGFGSYTTVEKQDDKALTRQVGFGGLTIPVDLVIDRADDGASVQDIVDTIDAFAGRGRKHLPGAAPRLIVDSNGLVPYDATVFPNVRWVVPTDGLVWAPDDDLNLTDGKGRPVLAACTITLLEHYEGSRLLGRQLAAAMVLQRDRRSLTRQYTVQQGESLITIARKRLGDPGRWQEIADLNGIRDPLSVRAGARLRLPS